MSAPDNSQISPDTVNEDVAPGTKYPKVRTLGEPPEIWDVVHETRAEFKPGSAFVGRLKATHPVGWAMILLIVGGGGVFCFMTLRNWSESRPAARPVQVEATKPETLLSSRPNPSNTTASSLPDQSPNIPPASTDTAESKTDESKIAGAAPAASLGSKVAVKLRPQNAASPTIAIGETVAAIRNKKRDQSSSLTAAGKATVARPVNKEASQASTAPGPKSDKDNGANPTAAKKQPDKGLSPQLIAPAKAGSTPKAKVIAWP
jgi:hypothetical protein